MSDTDYSALAAFAETSPLGVLMVDDAGVVRLANSPASVILGRPVGALTGARFADLLDPDGPPAATLLLAPGGRDSAERAFVHGTALRWCAVTSRPVPGFGGRLLHLADLTRIRELEKQSRAVTLLDPLTGLLGAPLLRDRLEHALALRERDPQRAVSVCVADVDSLDDVCALGAALAATIRTTDSLARIDTLLVMICEDTNDRGARALRHRLEMLPEVQKSAARIGSATARSGQNSFELLSAARRNAVEHTARRAAVTELVTTI